MQFLTTTMAILCATLLDFAAASPDLNVHFPGQLVPRADLLNANLMTFSSAVGGFSAPAITQSTDSDREFLVDGKTFTSFKQGWKRACDNQKNLCADFANSSAGRGKIEVKDCEKQHSDCENAAETQTVTAFASLQTQDSEFDYYCES